MSRNIYPQFGEVLANALKSISVSQAAFGNAIGRKAQSISSWKARGFIPLPYLHKVAGYFDMVEPTPQIEELKQMLALMRRNYAEEREMLFRNGGEQFNQTAREIKDRFKSKELGAHYQMLMTESVNASASSSTTVKATAQAEKLTADEINEAMHREAERRLHMKRMEDRRKYREEQTNAMEVLLRESLPSDALEVRSEINDQVRRFDVYDKENGVIIEIVHIGVDDAYQRGYGSGGFGQKPFGNRRWLNPIFYKNITDLAVAKRFMPDARVIMVMIIPKRFWDRNDNPIETTAEIFENSIPHAQIKDCETLGIEPVVAFGWIDAAKQIIDLTNSPIPKSFDLFLENPDDIDFPDYDEE